MADFIGRIEEKLEITKCMESDRSEFVVVYGRRRVGKTALIRNYFNDSYDFRFVGARNCSTAIQLKNFSEELSRFSKVTYPVPSTWMEAFRLLEGYLEKCVSRKKVVFIDEMPWIDNKQSGFVQALEYFWNSWVAFRDDIVLIACGSSSSWMVNNLVENQGGLHNRITRQIHLSPFTLYECKLYLQSRGFDWDDYQIIQCYMTFGGVPFYLSLLDPVLSLEQNINQLMFKNGSSLQREFDELYTALFNCADKYVAVVEALAQKRKGLQKKEIAEITGVSGGRLTHILANLERSDFIMSMAQFGKNVKNTAYKLVDFYTLFYYKFVKNSNSKDENFWLHHFNDASVTSWRGFSFEQVCLLHLRQIKKALGISGMATAVSTWRYVPENDGENGTQIDLLIDRVDRMIHLCEIKFTNGQYAISKDYAEKLKARASVFKAMSKTRKSLVHTFVTVDGVLKNSHSSLLHSEVTAKDLFEP